MTRIKRLPDWILPVLLILGGLAAALAGVYLLVGLAPTLIAGGVAAVLAGLLVDI